MSRARGQISLFLLLVIVPSIIVLALVTNVGRQSIRKAEMQGAADAGAIAAGTATARGMNAIAMSNKGMADVLTVMIVSQAVEDTAQRMPRVVEGMIKATEAAMIAFPEAAPALELVWLQLQREKAFYLGLQVQMKAVNEVLIGNGEGLGWVTMRQLDRLNQGIKSAAPLFVEGYAVDYARANGADAKLPGFVFTGGERLLPLLPIGRSSSAFIAAYAGEYPVPKLEGKARAVLFGACSLFVQSFCMSGPFAALMMKAHIKQNVTSLGGGAGRPQQSFRYSEKDLSDARTSDGRRLSDVLEDIRRQEDEKNKRPPGNYSGDIFRELSGMRVSYGGGLTWPLDPPKPMMLNDAPEPQGDWTIPNPDAPISLNHVRRELQLLFVAAGENRPPLLGGKQFEVQSRIGTVTYAQTEIFNPNDWYMFSQLWRARLARATVLNSKMSEVLSRFGLPAQSATVLSYLNMH